MWLFDIFGRFFTRTDRAPDRELDAEMVLSGQADDAETTEAWLESLEDG